jgi:plastocyanin
VFKSWQVFVFSLVPLALVFTGVIVGSIHFKGGDSTKEVFPTPAPRTASNAPPPPSAPAGSTVLQITAKGQLFDKRTLTAAAGQPVVLQFDNQDAGTIHNFALYTNRSATTKIYASDLITGPKVDNLSFTAPAAGSYYYRCDVHPDTMTGTFTSK